MALVRILFFASYFLATAYTCFGADTIRICSYNVLNYSVSNDDNRMPMYAAIMQEIKPDILLCSEVADNTLGPQFVSQVLTWDAYAFSPFHDGPDSDCQLFYNLHKFSLLSVRAIPTELRDILEVILERIPEAGQQPDTLACYLAHLKASNDPGDFDQRLREVKVLQANVVKSTYVCVAGDFNFYANTDDAYRALVDPSVGRVFVDPLGTNWVRNTASQASIYTQCTRENNVKGCGGGVTGGMDDRFDFIVGSEQLAKRILPNTYTAFGNDGVARLNSSINNPPNTIVSATIADALLCASDHLPVYVDVVLGDIRASVQDYDVAPHVFFRDSNLIIANCPPNQLISVTDVHGKTLFTGVSQAPFQTIPLRTLTPGMYAVRVGSYVTTLVY